MTDASGYRIDELIQVATQALTGLSESPKLDAELLLGHILQCERGYLFTWPEKIVETQKVVAFRELLRERQNGKPIAHLLGYREFWGLTLKVTPDTLIPRPDTEVLVETALQLCQDLPAGKNLSILDLGTGTGAIALSLKSELPSADITAIEFSKAALDVAKENSQTLKLPVNFLQSSWCENLPAGKGFSLIVSNPPYIENDDHHLQQGDVRFEPISALTSGEDGLDDIRIIAQQAHEHLLPAGWLILEHGYNQGLAVRAILSAQGYQQVETRQDYGGNDRISFGQKAI